MRDQGYAHSRELEVAAPRAVALVRQVLAEAGFSILYEIDMQKTFKDKLQKDFRFYTIIGICDPHLAYAGLQSQPDMGLLIPCNVVVQESGTEGVVVKAVAASRSWNLLGSRELVEVGVRAEAKIVEALDRLAQIAKGERVS
jgi:uncharacterized protein (DUF302 family)